MGWQECIVHPTWIKTGSSGFLLEVYNRYRLSLNQFFQQTNECNHNRFVDPPLHPIQVSERNACSRFANEKMALKP